MESLPDPHNPDPSKSRFRSFRDNPEARMTFIEHLGELRTRIVRSGIAVAVAVVVCYAFSNQIITMLARPLATLHGQSEIALEDETTLEGAGEESTGDGTVPARWVILNPIEPVLVKLKVSAYGGILLCFPYILYHICSFIFPGLAPNEKRMVQFLICGSSILGVAGVAVAYYAVFPLVMPYLVMFAPDFVEVQLRMNETLSLLLKGFVGFAIAFQFPMVVLVLVWMGLLSPKTLKEHRRTAIVILCFLSMLLTPPDPLSMIIMAGPLIILYEASIWASYLVVRRKRKKQAIEEGEG